MAATNSVDKRPPHNISDSSTRRGSCALTHANDNEQYGAFNPHCEIRIPQFNGRSPLDRSSWTRIARYSPGFSRIHLKTDIDRRGGMGERTDRNPISARFREGSYASK